MARDFTKFSPTVWQSIDFRSLSSDEARLAYIYLLTSQHQSNAGVFRLPAPYASHDLSWELEKYLKVLSEIECAGLIFVDKTTDEILITNWFSHNPPMNQSHLKGVVHTIERIESDELRQRIEADLDQVYFDRSQPGPNKPPNPDEQLPASDEIVSLPNPPKRPSDFSRADMEEMFDRKRKTRAVN